ncbi:MAG: hypothetical protein COY66_02865 [Candidatus Kerfeldbacteria bacterium CG_4_10_14_0_8_um_filter_42_10]|uniref:PEP-utilising enzyme mobile domain-containing protein n=1 Tax=Candidatus Kerfeldbacteria bacterium CG_4_10_14_0_8_um_filter_42_10 TaxID=2014248 RepID=A0A2M7RK55_9BACT|nr:MAG: hypothetical protein COY66_02865 [Candidatus Kerfeldbacteria bacterium CG_4_10_14_0_8_um_filter_42_10]
MDKWTVFETIFKCNPQTGNTYSLYLDKDYLDEYLTKSLGLKNYPTQELLYIYHNGNLDHCFNINQLNKLVKLVLNKVLANPNWAIKNNRDIVRRSNNVFKVSQEILKLNYQKLTNQELYQWYSKYFQAHLKMHVSGWFGNAVDYDGQMHSYLTNYLANKTRKLELKQSLAELFNQLTQINRLSHAQKAEKELLNIYKIINRSKRTKKLFLSSTSSRLLKIIPQINPLLAKLISNYQQKYGWISYQFEGPGWNEKHFYQQLKDWLKNSKNLPSKINSTSNKQAIFKKLSIDKKHQLLFGIFSDLVYLKGFRKDSMFFGCQARDNLFKEICRRKNLPIKLIRYIYPQEIKEVILKDGVSLDFLKRRYDYHLYHYQGKKSGKILVGLQAKFFVNSLNWKEDNVKTADRITGMIASPGFAQGRIKIINVVADMKKMKQSDILVSEATSPNLMPAIKKAAAIVTNVGGITCHAAIVSRELKIPCVIGTNIATRVLKDGDLVEVDATKGIVRKLKKIKKI